MLTAELRELIRARRGELLPLLTAASPVAPAAASRIPRAADSGAKPLSYAQQRLWFVTELEMSRARDGDGPSGLFNIHITLHLRGGLDVPVLETCLREIYRRHDILRTVFFEHDGVPMQRVRADAVLELAYADLSMVAAADRDEAVRARVQEEAATPLDLLHGPLFHCLLVKVAGDEHVLLVSLHHIIADGWSVEVLFKELTALYRAYRAGQRSPLPALPIQYGDYAVWQRDRVGRGELHEALGYWRERLQGIDALEAARDHTRPAMQRFNGALNEQILPARLAERIRVVGQRQAATPFMTLLAAFMVLLHRHTGQQRIVVGSPVANRGRAELESLIGMFVNNVVLASNVAGDGSFLSVLSRVRETCVRAFAHQEVPFEMLVDELAPNRDLSRNPLFQVCFLHQALSIRALQIDDLDVRVLPGDVRCTRFDLECHVVELQQGFAVRFIYNTDLFDASTIERMLAQYQRVLEAVVADPGMRIGDIDLLSTDERRAYFERSAGPVLERQADATVVSLFRAAAQRDPGAPALVSTGGTMTYAELDRESDRLASRLRTYGIAADVPVGVLLRRSSQMITAWLAALKAGAAYLPLDPDYPGARLEYMLQDSAAPLLITDQELAQRVPAYVGARLRMDEEPASPANADNVMTEDEPAAEQVAYLIYTSGSTGQPKGVAVEHRALANLIAWHNRAYHVAPVDRATQLAGLGFDACVWEVWPYLAAGASVYLIDEATRLSPVTIWHWLADNRITLTFVPTPMAEAMLREPIPGLLSLRALLTGGDRLRGRLPVDLPFRLVNHYGPTENAVVSISADVDLGDAAHRAPAIGRPINNVQAYVLDEHMQPVPDGVIGELYVGGASLARGYWRREELTRERFVPDPFGRPGSRLYRTGDLVRWSAEGLLEFIGRTDLQVKVRGYRIELGEVEQALLANDSVAAAVVAVREDTPGDVRLVGYVVAERGAVLTPETLRGNLSSCLPGYMVPSAMVLLDALPLTPNGKVDRAALPTPENERQVAQVFVAPTSELEQRIVTIWREVLGVEQVGIDDNFFEIGGNSLLAMRCRSLIGERLQRRLTMADIFGFPTVRALAGRCEPPASDRAAAPAAPGSLSHIQERARKSRSTIRRRGQTTSGEIAT